MLYPVVHLWEYHHLAAINKAIISSLKYTRKQCHVGINSVYTSLIIQTFDSNSIGCKFSFCSTITSLDRMPTDRCTSSWLVCNLGNLEVLSQCWEFKPCKLMSSTVSSPPFEPQISVDVFTP